MATDTTDAISTLEKKIEGLEKMLTSNGEGLWSKAQHQAQEVKEKSCEYISDHPCKSALVALGVGVLIGVLTRR